MIHRVTTSDSEWYNKWQRVTVSDNEWSFQLIFLFFRIKEEPTTKHSKGNSLNLEQDLKEGLYWIKSKKKAFRRNINIKKQELRQFSICDIYNFKNLRR